MFYFFLGNTPELSLLELRTLYSGEFNLIAKEIASYTGEVDLQTLPRLGGTRKVAQELAIVSEAELEGRLIELIIADEGGKNVAITSYLSKEMQAPSVMQIKKAVLASRPIRFVSMETTEHELLMLDRQHVSEFNIIVSGEQVIIAKTAWIFDAADWVSRDRDKPYRDIKRGMLPPKVARIMANLATRGTAGLTLADPFCGTGTVLAEGMMLGCHVVGSDTNPEAVIGAKSNLAWLASTPNLTPTTYDTFLADATHFAEHSKTVDAIATEPYMGPLLDERNPSSLEKVKNIAKGLGKLYVGCFKSWHKVLPDVGARHASPARVVMSIPSFAVYNRVIETISIDTLSSLGYNYVSSVAYGKPGAIVIRNITILEKK